MKIPLSSSRCADSLFWHFDELSNYSVKSGYWVGMNSFSIASGFSLSSSESWWKSLWRMNIPPKVKVFLWKACHNWLPTFSVLTAKKLPVDVLCPVCKLASESVGHTLWFCRFLKILKQDWLAAHGCSLPRSGSLVDFLLSCKSQLVGKDLECFWSPCGVHGTTEIDLFMMESCFLLVTPLAGLLLLCLISRPLSSSLVFLLVRQARFLSVLLLLVPL
ncbi:hypothetical protein ACOSQ4_009836 [Xanthoceras sorbifolium]